MNYLYQDKTIAKARAFSDYLNKSDYQTVIDIDATRDYVAKIDVDVAGNYIGKINVYYSPKKKTYKLTCQELKIASYNEEFLEKWQDFTHQTGSRLKNGIISAYVDGSFLNKVIGYGAVILDGESILYKISGKMDSKYEEHHQIAGELKAALESVSWAKKNGIKELDIYYDYKGIEMWARKKWKANKELTKAYQDYMQKQNIILHFHKVAAHSGNKWNEVADKLARDGSKS
ncbi:MAG: RNase H family protein [Candidatus Neomarinimicrobiota bacterium]